MNKKNIIKITLDSIMIIVLVLLYNKSAVNIQFHEIAGLIILGIFAIHLLLNYKWIIGITKKIASKNIPTKTKIGYAIDILLLICFLAIGVSGIIISKVVFHFAEGGMYGKTIHYFCSAISLILVGIHLGLHRRFITGMMNKIIKFPKKIVKTLEIVCAIVIFSYGSYSLTTTSFLQWLSMPFSTGQVEIDKMNGEGMPDRGERPDRSELPDSDMQSEDTTESDQAASTETDQKSSTVPDQKSRTEAGDLAQKGERPNSAGGFSFANVWSTFSKFLSIIFVFAVITSFVEIGCKKVFHKKRV